MRRNQRGRSWYGAAQKSLHVKLYNDVLDMLDKESSVDGMPRNRLINQACEYYLKQLDEERSDISLDKARECTLNSSMSNQVTVELTTVAWENLQHIARGMGCTVDVAAEHLLERAVREYDMRPFSYL